MATAPKTVAISTTPDTTSWFDLGTNLKAHFIDGILFLAIPVPADKSKLPVTNGSAVKAVEKPGSKLNVQVASSHGNVVVPGTGGMKLGLNAFAPQS